MKFIKIMLLSMFAVLSMSMSAFASDKITSVYITMSETKAEPGIVWEAEPTVRSNDYSISSVDWSTGYDSWRPGNTVTCTINIESAGKVIDKDVHVSVSRGERVNVSRNGSKNLRVRINYTPKVILEVPQNIWYEDDYTVTWDKVDYAGGYDVKIYKDGKSYKTLHLKKKSENSVDLSEYATDDGIITVSVRAVAPEGKSSSITASDYITMDEDYGMSIDYDSTVSGTFNDSGDSKKFKDQYGDYVSGWQYINQNWYYFDPADNNKASANKWMYINNNWYMFDGEGRMITGWFKDGSSGLWYYLNTDPTEYELPYGAMKTGWIVTGPGSPWYYLNPGIVNGYPAGAMLVNTTTPDGYYVNENGEWFS